MQKYCSVAALYCRIVMQFSITILQFSIAILQVYNATRLQNCDIIMHWISSL